LIKGEAVLRRNDEGSSSGRPAVDPAHARHAGGDARLCPAVRQCMRPAPWPSTSGSPRSPRAGCSCISWPCSYGPNAS